MRMERRADGRRYAGRRPDEAAADAMASAAVHGYALELRPETPVVRDEHFLERNIATGTWREIDALHGLWADAGCGWVNLRFGIEGGGAIVRVEANPTGAPFAEGALPDLLPGFDCGRLMTADEYDAHLPACGTKLGD